MPKGIRKVFSPRVARTYELVNHVLTFGLDIVWRRTATRIASEAGGRRWMDICSGTGETALELRRLAPKGNLVVSVDFSLPMLARASAKAGADGVAFSAAEAAALPFADGCFDLVIITFATRNLNVTRTHLLSCLREVHRVLKPGGVFVNLETSQPSPMLWRRLVHLYVSLAVRPVGALLSSSASAYAYLASTIPRFYGSGELGGILREAGFEQVDARLFLGGVAAVHRGVKG